MHLKHVGGPDIRLLTVTIDSPVTVHCLCRYDADHSPQFYFLVREIDQRVLRTRSVLFPTLLCYNEQSIRSTINSEGDPQSPTIYASPEELIAFKLLGLVGHRAPRSLLIDLRGLVYLLRQFGADDIALSFESAILMYCTDMCFSRIFLLNLNAAVNYYNTLYDLPDDVSTTQQLMREWLNKNAPPSVKREEMQYPPKWAKDCYSQSSGDQIATLTTESGRRLQEVLETQVRPEFRFAEWSNFCTFRAGGELASHRSLPTRRELEHCPGLLPFLWFLDTHNPELDPPPPQYPEGVLKLSHQGSLRAELRFAPHKLDDGTILWTMLLNPNVESSHNGFIYYHKLNDCALIRYQCIPIEELANIPDVIVHERDKHAAIIRQKRSKKGKQAFEAVVAAAEKELQESLKKNQDDEKDNNKDDENDLTGTTDCYIVTSCVSHDYAYHSTFGFSGIPLAVDNMILHRMKHLAKQTQNQHFVPRVFSTEENDLLSYFRKITAAHNSYMISTRSPLPSNVYKSPMSMSNCQFDKYKDDLFTNLPLFTTIYPSLRLGDDVVHLVEQQLYHAQQQKSKIHLTQINESDENFVNPLFSASAKQESDCIYRFQHDQIEEEKTTEYQQQQYTSIRNFFLDDDDAFFLTQPQQQYQQEQPQQQQQQSQYQQHSNILFQSFTNSDLVSQQNIQFNIPPTPIPSNFNHNNTNPFNISHHNEVTPSSISTGNSTTIIAPGQTSATTTTASQTIAAVTTTLSHDLKKNNPYYLYLNNNTGIDQAFPCSDTQSGGASNVDDLSGTKNSSGVNTTSGGSGSNNSSSKNRIPFNFTRASLPQANLPSIPNYANPPAIPSKLTSTMYKQKSHNLAFRNIYHTEQAPLFDGHLLVPYSPMMIPLCSIIFAPSQQLAWREPYANRWLTLHDYPLRFIRNALDASAYSPISQLVMKHLRYLRAFQHLMTNVKGVPQISFEDITVPENYGVQFIRKRGKMLPKAPNDHFEASRHCVQQCLTSYAFANGNLHNDMILSLFNVECVREAQDDKENNNNNNNNNNHDDGYNNNNNIITTNYTGNYSTNYATDYAINNNKNNNDTITHITTTTTTTMDNTNHNNNSPVNTTSSSNLISPQEEHQLPTQFIDMDTEDCLAVEPSVQRKRGRPKKVAPTVVEGVGNQEMLEQPLPLQETQQNKTKSKTTNKSTNKKNTKNTLVNNTITNNSNNNDDVGNKHHQIAKVQETAAVATTPPPATTISTTTTQNQNNKETELISDSNTVIQQLLVDSKQPLPGEELVKVVEGFVRGEDLAIAPPTKNDIVAVENFLQLDQHLPPIFHPQRATMFGTSSPYLIQFQILFLLARRYLFTRYVDVWQTIEAHGEMLNNNSNDQNNNYNMGSMPIPMVSPLPSLDGTSLQKTTSMVSFTDNHAAGYSATNLSPNTFRWLAQRFRRPLTCSITLLDFCTKSQGHIYGKTLPTGQPMEDSDTGRPAACCLNEFVFEKDNQANCIDNEKMIDDDVVTNITTTTGNTTLNNNNNNNMNSNNKTNNNNNTTSKIIQDTTVVACDDQNETTTVNNNNHNNNNSTHIISNESTSNKPQKRIYKEPKQPTILSQFIKDMRALYPNFDVIDGRFDLSLDNAVTFRRDPFLSIRNRLKPGQPKPRDYRSAKGDGIPLTRVTRHKAKEQGDGDNGEEEEEEQGSGENENDDDNVSMNDKPSVIDKDQNVDKNNSNIIANKNNEDNNDNDNNDNDNDNNKVVHNTQDHVPVSETPMTQDSLKAFEKEQQENQHLLQFNPNDFPYILKKEDMALWRAFAWNMTYLPVPIKYRLLRHAGIVYPIPQEYPLYDENREKEDDENLDDYLMAKKRLRKQRLQSLYKKDASQNIQQQQQYQLNNNNINPTTTLLPNAPGLGGNTLFAETTLTTHPSSQYVTSDEHSGLIKDTNSLSISLLSAPDPQQLGLGLNNIDDTSTSRNILTTTTANNNNNNNILTTTKNNNNNIKLNHNKQHQQNRRHSRVTPSTYIDESRYHDVTRGRSNSNAGLYPPSTHHTTYNSSTTNYGGLHIENTTTSLSSSTAILGNLEMINQQSYLGINNSISPHTYNIPTTQTADNIQIFNQEQLNYQQQGQPTTFISTNGGGNNYVSSAGPIGQYTDNTCTTLSGVQYQANPNIPDVILQDNNNENNVVLNDGSLIFSNNKKARLSTFSAVRSIDQASISGGSSSAHIYENLSADGGEQFVQLISTHNISFTTTTTQNDDTNRVSITTPTTNNNNTTTNNNDDTNQQMINNNNNNTSTHTNANNNIPSIFQNIGNDAIITQQQPQQQQMATTTSTPNLATVQLIVGKPNTNQQQYDPSYAGSNSSSTTTPRGATIRRAADQTPHVTDFTFNTNLTNTNNNNIVDHQQPPILSFFSQPQQPSLDPNQYYDIQHSPSPQQHYNNHQLSFSLQNQQQQQQQQYEQFEQNNNNLQSNTHQQGNNSPIHDLYLPNTNHTLPYMDQANTNIAIPKIFQNIQINNNQQQNSRNILLSPDNHPAMGITPIPTMMGLLGNSPQQQHQEQQQHQQQHQQQQQKNYYGHFDNTSPLFIQDQSVINNVPQYQPTTLLNSPKQIPMAYGTINQSTNHINYQQDSFFPNTNTHFSSLPMTLSSHNHNETDNNFTTTTSTTAINPHITNIMSPTPDLSLGDHQQQQQHQTFYPSSHQYQQDP